MAMCLQAAVVRDTSSPCGTQVWLAQVCAQHANRCALDAATAVCPHRLPHCNDAALQPRERLCDEDDDAIVEHSEEAVDEQQRPAGVAQPGHHQWHRAQHAEDAQQQQAALLWGQPRQGHLWQASGAG